MIMLSLGSADAQRMDRRASIGTIRASWLGVVAVAFALALAAIAGEWMVQDRASASRHNHDQMDKVGRDFNTLQSMPFGVIGADDQPGAPSRLLKQMQATEADIVTTLAGLPRASHALDLRDAGPYRRNLAILERIRMLLVANRQADVDELGATARRLQVRVDRQFDNVANDYHLDARRAQNLASYGSAAVIVVLVSLFGVFYLRGQKSHAVAQELVIDNARMSVNDTQLEVIQRLAIAAEYRDDDTGQHTRRVGRLSVHIGAALDLPADQLELLGQAATMHDVGKIGIPDSILLKRGRLTKTEFERMKAHTTVGAGMLAGRTFPLLAMAEQISLTHHERWDGSGYPDGRKGEQIPLVGRIVAIADAFDALTHARPYKDAWTVADALTEIGRQKGAQFDPAVVEAFLRVLPLALAEMDGEPAVTTAPCLAVAHAA